MTKITENDVKKIADILKPEKLGKEADHFRLKVTNKEEKRVLILEIFPEILLGKKQGILIVVYTGNSHLQLHNCSGFVLSEELGEVTFITESDDRLSGLVVESGASCSLYSGINRDLISSDFTNLGVEVMLSGVALSLAEDLIGSDNSEDEEDKK